MRVLMIVQLIDEHDWLRGFIVTWVRALAARVERLDVLTLEQHDAILPSNVTVHSMGKERGHHRAREFAVFHRTLSRLTPHVDVIFSHMTPRYTWLAAPHAMLHGKPQVLWYVHRHVSWELRLAHAAASRIVTASEESFNIRSNKVRILGHGVDLTHFNAPVTLNSGCTILSVGRLSPIKNHHLLIEAVAHLRDRGFTNFEVLIAGGETTESRDYPRQLRSLVRELNLEAQVRFLGAIPHRDMPALYQQATLSVNLCPTGGMDKAVLESMASGIPTMVHNSTFLPLLADERANLWSESLEPSKIADQLMRVLNMPDHERDALSLSLADRVRTHYGLDALMDRLIGVFREVARTSEGAA